MGKIPQSFGNLANLKYLFLSFNQLEGTLNPYQFNHAQYHTRFAFFGNCFDSLTPEFNSFLISSHIGSSPGYFYFYPQDCKKVKSKKNGNSRQRGNIDQNLIQKLTAPPGFQPEVPPMPKQMNQ